MDDFTLQVFSSEVHTQALWAVTAHEALESSVRPRTAQEVLEGSVGANAKTGDPFLWLSLLLNCAANVSKLLWGVNEARAAERGRLREHFQVAEDSPVKARTLRNHFEHFDERITDWARPRPDGPRRFFADQLIGGPAGPRTIAPMLFTGGASPTDAFRYYDRGGFVIFRGERFEITPIIAELRRLLTFPVYRPTRHL